jgi:cell division protein ZapA (FtsZ GTPase activity inhibitor)
MDQKISIKIAERTFNLTAPTPEKEEIIRLAADAINQHLQAYTRRYPGKSLAELMPMVALNECVSRITVQREKAAQEAEAEQLGKDMANYLTRTGK